MEQPSRIREGSDRAMRRLFGHPEVVADLLRGFVPVSPLAEFDPRSLRALPDDRVDFRFDKRESDGTWGFSLAGGEQVVLIFEMQSYEDRIMAGRMAVEVAMFCENFLRTSPGELLPGVLPVVFYTGRKPWRAARSLRELTSGRAGLLTYFAESCYLLLETGVLASGSLPERNLVSLIVRMEAAHGTRELWEVLASEREFLGQCDPSLWQDYLTWAYEVLAPTKFQDMDRTEFESLQEGLDMIAERIQEEREELKQQFRAEGLAEGLARSLAREKALLRLQIARKFGDETAEKWSERVSVSDDDDRLLELRQMIFDCDTGEDLLQKL